MKDRVAVITGASRGIGAAVAEAYAARGAHVVLVARTVGGLEEVDDRIQAAGGSATLVPMDLKDMPAIDRLGAAIADRWGRLDVLVGNAGILGRLGPIGHLTPDIWDDLMTINVTANWRLIRSLDPLLRASTAGRAIFVTSTVAQDIRPFWGGYAASKAALECLVKTYAAEAEKSDLRVNLINPLRTRTAMRAQAMPGEDPQTVAAPETLGNLFVKLALPDWTGNGEIISAERPQPNDA